MALGGRVIGTFGDVDFVTYGGGVVLKTPHGYEAEYVEPPTDVEESDPSARWTVYRVNLDPEVPGFGDLKSVAETMDYDEEELIADFTSLEPMTRLQAYEAMAGYYGWHEFDQYPLSLRRAEVNRRYAHVGRKRNPIGSGAAIGAVGGLLLLGFGIWDALRTKTGA